MKKDYYSPTMKVVPLRSKTTLLAGSIGVSESTTTPVGGQGQDGDDGD